MKRIGMAFLLVALAAPAFASVEQSKEAKLYDKGSEAVDDQEWSRAATLFRAVAGMHQEHADAALYWLAYSQSKIGLRSEALSSLAELHKRYPKSRWNEDARALEVEIRQSAGKPLEPELAGDEDAKLIALAMQISSAPDRALPTLIEIVAGNQPLKTKQRALFVLTQSGNPKAFAVLDRVARDSSKPELQDCAVRFLGAAGARQELSTLYVTEPSTRLRGRIIESMVIGGNADKLVEIAKTEKVIELRLAAIRNLGLMGGTGQQLVTIYGVDVPHEVRRAVIQSLFLQANERALVQLARSEKDEALKRDIRVKLVLMRSKEAGQ